MATIYRFIVEQKTTTNDGSRKGGVSTTPSKRTTAKKGKYVSIFGGDKGGVEHNRKMRAINPLLNRATGGWWEKGTRLGRAGAGLVQKNTETGKMAISGVSIAIILAFLIQSLMKIQRKEQIRAEKRNAQNFKQMENGLGAIHSEYEIVANAWNGRQTYNQNK